MAVLAERRDKVKWTLNPRGKFWSEDETSYGQRMLRKMGWEQGKGLGKNEDGNKEHIKVTYKNDKKGLGAKGHDDDWIAHQDDFNSVLSSLNEQFSSSMSADPKETAVESLEKKSKSSRSRVHYHKFIRGKDLTTYSSKDIAAIFGNKKKENDKSNEVELMPESIKEESAEASMIITYNSGQNIQDYFKQKMAALVYNKIDTTGWKNSTQLEDDDSIVSGKDIIHSDPELHRNLIKENQDQENTITKKRKKHKKKKVENDKKFSQNDSFNENLQAKLNEKSEQQLTNHDIREISLNPTVIPETCRNGVTETLVQDTHESKTDGSMINEFTKSSEQDESILSKRRKKKKITAITKQSVNQESNDSGIVVTDSATVHRSDGTSKEILKREVKDVVSSDEVTEGTSPKKAKKLKKNKNTKRTESIYPNLNVHNAKTSVRYNALQQMKVYYDIFPNRNILSLLKKYEKVCDNFKNSGLASSNLLSVHGYGNEFLLKHHPL